MKPTSEKSYITGIDGLRAIAILSVLIYHTNPGLLPGGFAGVDLFFVISGFVVSMATSAHRSEGFGELLLAFYRRRVVRILPAALVFIVVAQLLAILFVPVSSKLTVPDMTAAAATVGFSNVVLWAKAGDYFSPATELNPFTHTWSLAVEEQFYFLFPFLAYLMWGRHGGGGAARGGVALLVVLTGASLAAAVYFMRADPTFAFYMLPARLWELAAGVLLFRAIQTRRERLTALTQRHGAWLSLAGVLLLAGSFAWLKPAFFPIPGAVAPVLGACLMILVVTVAPQAPVTRLLSHPVLRYFGQISYSLYLWHWGVIVLMQWTVGLEAPHLQLLAMVLSIGLAHLSYAFVETPTRKSPWVSAQGSRKLVSVGLVSMASVGVVVAALVVARPQASLSVTRDQDIWHANSVKATPSCMPERTRQAFMTGFVYTFEQPSCFDKARNQQLFVVGDSHAFAYQRLVANMVHGEHIRGVVYSSPGCASLPNRHPEPHCVAFLEQTFKLVAAHARPGDVLLLPGLRTERYREFWEPVLRPYAPQTPYADEDRAQLRQFLQSLAPLLDMGVRVILEAPKPVYKFAPSRCSDWFNRHNPHCEVAPTTRAEQFARKQYMSEVMAQAVQREPRIELWDPFPLLCDAEVCEPYIDGKPIVSDGDHLTGFANDHLSPAFQAILNGGASHLSRFTPAGESTKQ